MKREEVVAALLYIAAALSMIMALIAAMDNNPIACIFVMEALSSGILIIYHKQQIKKNRDEPRGPSLNRFRRS